MIYWDFVAVNVAVFFLAPRMKLLIANYEGYRISHWGEISRCRLHKTKNMLLPLLTVKTYQSAAICENIKKTQKNKQI